MRNKKLISIIPLAVGVFTLSVIVVGSILAWTEPTAAPAGGTVNAPLNTGANAQTKSGSLTTGILNVNNGAGACCSANYTFSINDGTAGQPTLQFHDSGVAEGQIILQNDIANGQRGLLFQSTQTTFGGRFTGNLIANGELQSTMTSGYGQLRMVAGDYGAFLRNDGANTYLLLTDAGNQYGIWNALRPFYVNNVSGNVTVGTKLCLSGVCRNTWPGSTAQSCPSGQGMTGIDASGNIVCSGSGFNPFTYPCNQTLPTGAKKIFVTSTTYSAWDATTETGADSKCQAAANAVGYPGTFKALVFMGSRNINSVLPSGVSFWNGQKNGGSCQWNLIAYNVADFFADNGGGVYLQNPITYNEQGLSMSGIGVWTSFRASGGGNYDLLSHTLQSCHGFGDYGNTTNTWKGACYYRGANSPPNVSGADYYREATHWYGIAGSGSTQWAYNDWCQSSSGYGGPSWNNCFNNQRAFYCVEQ